MITDRRPSASSPSGSASRPGVDGKFLAVDGHRFLVKGVAYGTFAPDPNGMQFPAPDRIAQDLQLMAEAGINTVRTYTLPPESLFDEAARHGLRVMVGIPWTQHIAFLDDPQLVRQIRQDAVATVRRLAPHPATLMFAVGNEIAPAIVRWHGQRRIERFLRDLYEEIKSAAPESLLTYVNFPPTEYLDLDVFDVCAFNVYLHREEDLRAYLARLQQIAGARPLLLAEAGADSIREGAEGQACITAMHLRAAYAEGACGAIAFSWTDEWWRGGHSVEDWAFGLVDAERRPKPALVAVEKVFRDAPFTSDERARWPKVSVIVCAYNAADTLHDCLSSLAALTYPNYEVIVVNDGSRDATGAIARLHAGVRIVEVPNGGLAAARNVGLAAATGEIVAYTDADTRVDPDWLTYLVQPFLTQTVIGSGGPNVVPQDDPWIAQGVARAPGGPVHVLLDDRIAEHVPGCNMAFRRDALLAVGGFNPVFQRAGDDVDICWRLQAKGLHIGFAPSALVWHHHRQTIGAFWRQQVGYGEGEVWLVAHHPEKFAGSDMLWRGRIYSPLPFIRSFTRSRVSTGVWGTAAFPSVYSTGARLLQFFPHSLAWITASTMLLAAGALGQLTPSHGAAWLLLALGALGWTTTIARCVMFARRSDLKGLSAIGQWSSPRSRLLYQLLIAWLHLLQPLARMRGRLRGMWSRPQVVASEHVTPQASKTTVPSFGDARGAVSLLLGDSVERSFWSQSWIANPALLTELADILRTSRLSPVVDLDDGWRTDRDLSLACGSWGWLHVRVLVEEHGDGRCLARVGTHLRPSLTGTVQALALAIPLVMAASASLALRWPLVSAAALLAVVAIAVRAMWQTAHTREALNRALMRVTAARGMVPLSVQPAEVHVRRHLPSAAGAIQTTIVAMLVGSAGLGVTSIAREAMVAYSATSVATADSWQVDAGGVAVGVSGDLFVANGDVIERLRPRPPLDAVWTADDIGTAGYPLLGSPIPFETAADIALAPNGDIYVADARNNRLCRIDRATGKIVTIVRPRPGGFAGDANYRNPSQGAALSGPSAVAVAHNGDLYVADTLNNRVRMLEHATGLIRTIAGDGATGDAAGVGDDGAALRAHLKRPSGLAVAPNGDLYIADTGHNRVRRVNARTGIITTVAGDGTTGALGDGGPAIGARLAAPMGLALVSKDQQLTIYVADSLNDRVRVIDATGRIFTLSGPDKVVAPVRIAYHPAGWLYIKDASPDGVTAVATTTLPRTELARTRGAGRREM